MSTYRTTEDPAQALQDFEDRTASRLAGYHDYGTPTAPLAVEKKTRLKRMKLSEWSKAHPPAEYIIDGVLQAGKGGIICGPEKSFKSAVLADLTVSLASGTPFLGSYQVSAPGNVLYLVNEGEDTIKDRLHSVALARGVDLSQFNERIEVASVTEEPGEPIDLENPEHLAAIHEAAREFRPAVVIVDSAYKALSGEGQDNRSKMGRNLARLDAISLETGAAFLLAWHANKSTETGRYLTRRDISWAGAGAWMRQWIFLNHRNEQFIDGKVSLLLEIGSSRGCTFRGELFIDEGRGWSKWETRLTNQDDIAKQKAQAKDNKLEANADAIRRMLRKGDCSKRKLREANGPGGPGIDDTAVNKALAHMAGEWEMAAGKVHLLESSQPQESDW